MYWCKGPLSDFSVNINGCIHWIKKNNAIHFILPYYQNLDSLTLTFVHDWSKSLHEKQSALKYQSILFDYHSIYVHVYTIILLHVFVAFDTISFNKQRSRRQLIVWHVYIKQFYFEVRKRKYLNVQSSSTLVLIALSTILKCVHHRYSKNKQTKRFNNT